MGLMFFGSATPFHIFRLGSGLDLRCLSHSPSGALLLNFASPRLLRGLAQQHTYRKKCSLSFSSRSPLLVLLSSASPLALLPGRLMAVDNEGGAGGFNNLMLKLERETGRTLYRTTSVGVLAQSAPSPPSPLSLSPWGLDLRCLSRSPSGALL